MPVRRQSRLRVQGSVAAGQCPLCCRMVRRDLARVVPIAPRGGVCARRLSPAPHGACCVAEQPGAACATHPQMAPLMTSSDARTSASTPMIAQIPISVPMPNTRLTQLARLASANLGTSMLAAPATAARSSGSRFCAGAARHSDGVERRALQVHQRCRRRGRGPPPRPCARPPPGRPLRPAPPRDRRQGGYRGPPRMRSGSPSSGCRRSKYDGFGAERPMRQASLTQLEHGLQQLLERFVAQRGGVGLRQHRAIRQPVGAENLVHVMRPGDIR
jgi:hypothetical protein